MSDKKLFAVFGKPVIHSRGPQIFNFMFNNLNLNARYLRITADSAEEIIKTARSLNLCGFNITSPFKQAIINHLDDIDKHSHAIEAVNTVSLKKGKYLGFNTDYSGVTDALKNHGNKILNTSAAILGAGGAARAAAYGLIKEGAKKIVLINRTEKRAKKAAQKLGCEYAPITKAKEVIRHSDTFISCIPSPQKNGIPDYFKKGLTVLDANYKEPHLLQTAKAKGCSTIDGREWLIYQAFPAFYHFFGYLPPHNLINKIKDQVFFQEELQKSNIALVGFVGSGKSTIGNLLAEKTGRRFIDIDTEIEKACEKTIPKIFKQKKETGFRKIEKSMIQKFISSSKNTVFSLGGGAVLDKINRTIIKQNCCIIWLWASLPAALKRIDVNLRPLLYSKDPETTANNILADRIPYYAGISDMLIDTESGKIEKITARIKNETD